MITHKISHTTMTTNSLKEIIQNHEVIIIGMEHYTPLGVIRALGEQGINPIFIGIKYKAPVASASKYVKKSYFVNNDSEALKLLLKEYGDFHVKFGKKPFLQFSDDSTVELFEKHYDELKDKFIMFNAGGNGRIAKYLDKFEILECARRHGIKILPTVVVKCGEIPPNFDYPIITKAISPNAGAWKGDVHICLNEKELEQAFKTIQSPLVLIQKYIEKKTETTIEGYSFNKGKDMFAAIQCTYLYTIKGYYSPYHIDTPIEDSSLKSKIASMIEEIGFEGVFDAEFLVDQDDELYFLEINFRNTTWSYSSAVAGYPLSYLWCESMLTGNKPILKEFEPFTSMCEPIDYSKRVEEGRCTFPEWLFDFKTAKCTYYYDPNDIKPYKVMCENWNILK